MRRTSQTTSVVCLAWPVCLPSRLRRARLLASTAILLAGTIAFALPASAADECGTPSGAPLEVTCDAADEPNYSNHFPNGIIYDPVQDLTVYVDDGVTIEAGANKGIDIAKGIGSTPDIVLYVYDTDEAIDIDTSNSGIYVRGRPRNTPVRSA